MWANMLRPYQLGKAPTSHKGPWSCIRASRVASAQESLAIVPLHERLGVGRDVKIFVQTGIRLTDLGLSVLEQLPVSRVGPETGEIPTG